jgi:histidinol-phosphate aminotransferase
MLDYVCRLFLGAEDRIVNCPPTFGMYEFDAALEGAHVHQIWRRPDYGVDVDAIDACCRYGEDEGERQPKLMFLTSPNNPTGTWLPDDDLRRLLALPVMVVLDEAYVEFSDHPSRVGWVAEHQNLVVLRTFSKAAGMAGLRLGYAVCPNWLMPHLWTFKQPYNVNVAAAVGGLASLRHAEQMAEVVNKIRSERQRLFEALCGVEVLRPVASQANFILCPVEGRDARSLKLSLEAQGILVRHYDKPGLSNCIRISVGRPDQTDRLMAALAAVTA